MVTEPSGALISDLDVCRARIAKLEAAIEQWDEVMNRTGTEREVAYRNLVGALVQDFREAVICSPDMTDEQRAFWLSQPEEVPHE